MCGFIGVISKDHINKTLIEESDKFLSCRGPDDHKWLESNLEEKNIISGYSAIIDQNKVDLSVNVFVQVSLEKQFLIPEDFTANLDSGVIPTENFTNSDLEPRHYASDVAKRPLGGISFESTGVGEVHIRLEDGTVGVIAGSHRPAGDGFLIADGELVTTGDTTTLTNENARLGMEFSLHPGRAEQGLGHGVIALNRAPKGDNNNIGERLAC